MSMEVQEEQVQKHVQYGGNGGSGTYNLGLIKNGKYENVLNNN